MIRKELECKYIIELLANFNKSRVANCLDDILPHDFIGYFHRCVESVPRLFEECGGQWIESVDLKEYAAIDDSPQVDLLPKC